MTSATTAAGAHALDGADTVGGAGDADDLVAGGDQGRGEDAAEDAAGTGEQDTHDELLGIGSAALGAAFDSKDGAARRSVTRALCDPRHSA